MLFEWGWNEALFQYNFVVRYQIVGPSLVGLESELVRPCSVTLIRSKFRHLLWAVFPISWKEGNFQFGHFWVLVRAESIFSPVATYTMDVTRLTCNSTRFRICYVTSGKVCPQSQEYTSGRAKSCNFCFGERLAALSFFALRCCCRPWQQLEVISCRSGRPDRRHWAYWAAWNNSVMTLLPLYVCSGGLH